MRLRWLAGILLILAAVGFLIFRGKPNHIELTEETTLPAATQSEIRYPDEGIEPVYVAVEPESIPETEEPAPTNTPAQQKPNVGTTSAFVLTIRGSRIAVGSETTEEALKKRPGWLDTSAHPGEPGVCVVYGHRNRRHLRVLEKVELGDEIMVTTEGDDDSVFYYIVTQIDIADDLSEITISSVEEPTLLLVTCYPFRYSGNAPQKYIVIAKERREP